MRKKCKTCNCNSESDYCFRHKSRSPLPKISKKLMREVKEIVGKIEQGNPMWEFFLSIWKKKEHKSEVSGEWLGNEALSIFFHHILEKEKYPDIKYEEDNIILLTWEEHDSVEADMYKYEEINKRRVKLLEKYGK